MSEFAVKRFAGGNQASHFLQPPGCGEVWAACCRGGVGLKASPRCFRACGEPDHEPGRSQQLTVRGPQHCPAAGGKHEPFALTQLAECRRFAVAEAGITLGGEDLGDGPARDSFDEIVGIGEVPPEPLCKQPADGGLSAPAGTDEDDW